ncbi:MAG: outer membrane lipoprotein-sorting protein [Deltaproteobacteria bacterium RIFOXYB12_FULL_58_9]|nr:MAG: outer membrane lipoprotein-sorting protein [Deltaproteobacteria bacterium RIFOXYB12_FULL_58_9]
MKNTILTIAGICLGLLSNPTPASSAELDAKQILDRVDDVWRGDSAQGKMTMRVVTAHWTRELKIEFWSKGKDKSLMRILAPKKEMGTTTLMVEHNIWNYLPKVKRVIKVPSSMMGGSWMGSHFTNDDLVKDSRMADDYTFEISFNGKQDRKNVIEITCIPNEDAAVVWGKIIVQVEQDTYLPTKMTYFNEDLEVARTMIFSDVRRMADRTIPAVATIIPADEPKESTTITYDDIAFDVPIQDGLFSKRSLER